MLVVVEVVEVDVVIRVIVVDVLLDVDVADCSGTITLVNVKV